MAQEPLDGAGSMGADVEFGAAAFASRDRGIPPAGPCIRWGDVRRRRRVRKSARAADGPHGLENTSHPPPGLSRSKQGVQGWSQLSDLNRRPTVYKTENSNIALSGRNPLKALQIKGEQGLRVEIRVVKGWAFLGSRLLGSVRTDSEQKPRRIGRGEGDRGVGRGVWGAGCAGGLVSVCSVSRKVRDCSRATPGRPRAWFGHRASGIRGASSRRCSRCCGRASWRGLWRTGGVRCST